LGDRGEEERKFLIHLDLVLAFEALIDLFAA